MAAASCACFALGVGNCFTKARIWRFGIVLYVKGAQIASTPQRLVRPVPDWWPKAITPASTMG